MPVIITGLDLSDTADWWDWRITSSGAIGYISHTLNSTGFHAERLIAAQAAGSQPYTHELTHHDHTYHTRGNTWALDTATGRVVVGAGGQWTYRSEAEGIRVSLHICCSSVGLMALPATVVDYGHAASTGFPVSWDLTGTGTGAKDLAISSGDTNRALYAFVEWPPPGTQPTVAWMRSGQADENFTLIADSGVQTGNPSRIWAYRLLNPTAGTGEVRASDGLVAGFFVTGVDQSSPEIATATNYVQDQTSTITISAPAGSLVLDAAAWYHMNSTGMAAPTPGPDQNVAWAWFYDSGAGFNDGELAGSYGTSLTRTWTSVAVTPIPPTDWASAAVAVRGA